MFRRLLAYKTKSRHKNELRSCTALGWKGRVEVQSDKERKIQGRREN